MRTEPRKNSRQAIAGFIRHRSRDDISTRGLKYAYLCSFKRILSYHADKLNGDPEKLSDEFIMSIVKGRRVTDVTHL